MSDQQEQIQKLKQHFGRRVTDQARIVIDLWQRLSDEFWKSEWYDRMYQAVDRLNKFAARFQQDEILAISESLIECFKQTGPDQAPDSMMISKLESLLYELSVLATRRGDHALTPDLHLVKKPLYILLQDTQLSQLISEQLRSFGFNVQAFNDEDEFRLGLAYRYPTAMIIDIDFYQPEHGLALIEEVQQHLEPKIDVLFYSEHHQGVEMRLRALRAGGFGFVVNKMDIVQLVELFEPTSEVTMSDAHRVLVVEDSRSQAMQTVKVLNNAGMITHAVINPLEVMEALEEFEPEVILMDMYMPHCSGIELSSLIRQDHRYDSLPIIYLSSEQDIEKQLIAMAKGGDEFLTKPVRPEYLVGTIRNRSNRARILNAKMTRDSLTGLLDHSHLLQQLKHEYFRVKKRGTMLTFAMIDIDRFKQVNDTYGHDIGDKVIKSLALFLRQRLRKTDTIGRYGGEEFGIILPDTTVEIAKALFDEILANFSQVQHATGRGPIQVTFSAGLASMEQGGEQKLSKLADIALYQAKEGGRNRVCIYQPD
jgi:diguanylate cyclase (GGDEF)-like protein